jgi:hypothetical protein
LTVQEAYVKASNYAGSFGRSVAISGDTLVVGSPAENNSATGVNGDQSTGFSASSGPAYVFTRIGTTWTQEAYLKASNAQSTDRFGGSVDIDGDTIVVGATGEDSSATGVNGDETDNLASSAGAAYVFTRTGTTWTQQAYLKASNSEASDLFGESVAISGDTIAVSAIWEDSSATDVNGDEDNNLAGNAGAVYVFTRTGTTWSQQAYVKCPSGLEGENFGFSVDVDGDTLAVGTPEMYWPDQGVGSVHVFTRTGTTWTHQAQLQMSNPETPPRFGSNEGFGQSVAISGDTIVAGAPAESSSATGGESDNSESSAGAVYVFTRTGSAWTQQAYLKAEHAVAGERFGAVVAIEGDIVVVGSRWERSEATGLNGDSTGLFGSADGVGAAWVFQRTGVLWSQQTYVKASNAEGATGAAGSFGDLFGWSAAISGDTVVVGARDEASTAKGVNGDETDNGRNGAGAVYVYR